MLAIQPDIEKYYCLDIHGAIAFQTRAFSDSPGRYLAIRNNAFTIWFAF